MSAGPKRSGQNHCKSSSNASNQETVWYGHRTTHLRQRPHRSLEREKFVQEAAGLEPTNPSESSPKRQMISASITLVRCEIDLIPLLLFYNANQRHRQLLQEPGPHRCERLLQRTSFSWGPQAETVWACISPGRSILVGRILTKTFYEKTSST